MDLINGLPAHILFVHVVVVLVPLTALLVVAAAVWPAVARRLGLALPLVAFFTLATVPVTKEAGEWLERHVGSDPLVRKHAELGDGLLPWVAGLFVLAAAVWWVTRRSAAAASAAPDGASRAGRLSAPVRVVVSVLCLGVAAGAVVDVYRIGDSGAQAAWHDGYSKTATKGSGDGDEG